MFEAAVEAVIAGNEETLARLLQTHPELIRARSSEGHRATLLHYIAANGVEDERQKSPANAVAIARMLLNAGAEPDALADMYGCQCTTMSMLASSTPPAEAGVQVPLIEILLDYGADPNGKGTGRWVSPVMTALAFGFSEAARTLVRRGARVDRLALAAGLGYLTEVQKMLPQADEEDRHRALALAAHHGHVEIVQTLLDAGENPDRFNPDGLHSHSTPMHQAALVGHEPVVRLLIERGARVDIPDQLWKATPAGWAEHGGKHDLAAYLRARER